MTDAEIRLMLADALADAAAYGFDEERRQKYLSGGADYGFDELEMDSFSRMELCIAIETRTGVSIAPDELQYLGSLGGLAGRVRQG